MAGLKDWTGIVLQGMIVLLLTVIANQLVESKTSLASLAAQVKSIGITLDKVPGQIKEAVSVHEKQVNREFDHVYGRVRDNKTAINKVKEEK